MQRRHVELHELADRTTESSRRGLVNRNCLNRCGHGMRRGDPSINLAPLLAPLTAKA